MTKARAFLGLATLLLGGVLFCQSYFDRTDPEEVEIRRLADEARLKMHLAGMELKEKWKTLEPELIKVENDLVAVGEKVEAKISPQLDSLAAGLRKFVADLHKAKPDEPAKPPAG
jgi:hypothetical protein